MSNKVKNVVSTVENVASATQAQVTESAKTENGASLIAERSKGIATILRKQSTLFDGLHGVNPESVQGMVKLALVVESETLVATKLKQVMDDLDTMRNESVLAAKEESFIPSILTVENQSAGKHDKRKRLTLKIDRKRASHKNIAWFMRLHKAWIALNADI